MFGQKFWGLFHSLLVMQTFAVHLSTITGSKWVHGLYGGSSPPKPHAALALAAAAVSKIF